MPDSPPVPVRVSPEDVIAERLRWYLTGAAWADDPRAILREVLAGFVVVPGERGMPRSDDPIYAAEFDTAIRERNEAIRLLEEWLAADDAAERDLTPETDERLTAATDAVHAFLAPYRPTED